MNSIGPGVPGPIKSNDKKALPLSIPKITISLTDVDTNTALKAKTIQDNVQLMITQSTQRRTENKKLEPDPKFQCEMSLFEKHLPQLNEQLDKIKDFDTAAFLRGSISSSPEVFKNNQEILDDSARYIEGQVKQLVKEKSIPPEDAYKLMIGILDTFDDKSTEQYKKSSNAPQSTFALRSALLLSAQQNGVELHSWMVYTKSDKPASGLWTFLDNWKNWVPEAQGAIAKYTEATYAKALELSKGHPEGIVIFFSGGYGAGKSYFAKQLLQEGATGAVSPDSGKQIVRRTSKKIPHSVAHIHGSQVAYKIFDNLIKNLSGTAVYDSSLSSPEDIAGYLKKSKAAGKKMVIYSIERKEIARVLAVLAREFEGEDPRIPPDFIIRSAINDKLNRVACMNVVLEYNENVKEEKAPEYRVYLGNRFGWDTQEVAVITPHHIEKVHHEMEKRLALEGIKIDMDTQTIRYTKTREELESFFTNEFERPVKEIMKGLSRVESKKFFKTFGNRKLIADVSQSPIHDVESFYEALSDNIKEALPKKAFKQAFESLKPETHNSFFNSIQSEKLQAKINKQIAHIKYLEQSVSKRNKQRKREQLAYSKKNLEALEAQLHAPISYLDLPVRAALIINQNLLGDPWHKV